MTYRVRVWLHGLVAAVINGVSTSAVVILADPTTFNLFQGGAAKLGLVAATAGALAFFTYLKDHPLPDPDKDSDFHDARAHQMDKAASAGSE